MKQIIKNVNHIKDKVLGLFEKDEEHTYRNIANDKNKDDDFEL